MMHRKQAKWRTRVAEVSNKFIDKGDKCAVAYYKHKFYYIVEHTGYHGDKYYTAAVMDTRPSRYKSAWSSPNKVFDSFDEGIYYHENYVFV